METWNGNYIPSGADPWNLVDDMRRHATQNNRVIPVFSKSERDDLRLNAPGGTVPEGTVALRLDQSSKGPVFDIHAGGVWVAGDTGWQDLTSRLKNGWVASTGTVPPAVKIRNGEVQLRGQIANADAEPGEALALNLPSGYGPTSAGGALYFPLGSKATTSMAAMVRPDGTVNLWQSAKSGAIRPLNAIRYGLT